MIVKLVNLLPVAVHSTIDLTGLGIATDIDAIKTVLQGKPNDRNASSQETRGIVSDTLIVEMPAYSFTVYRLKTKNRITDIHTK